MLSNSLTEFESAIGKILDSLVWKVYLGRAIKYVIESGIEVDWSEAVDAAIKHVVSNNGFTDQNIPSRRALDALLFITPLDKKYRDSVAPLLKRGEFYNFVGAKPEERAHKAALLLAVCSPKGIEALSCDRQIGVSQQGMEAIESVFKSESPDDAKRLMELIQEFGVEEPMRGFAANSGWQMFGTLIEFSMNEPSCEWFNYDASAPLDSVWLYGEHLKRISAADSEMKIHKYVEFLQEKHKAIKSVEEKGFSKADLQRCAS